MTTVGIPNWDAQGVLPPNDPVDPSSAERSPYNVSLTDFALHFGTTEKRQAILRGFLDFRAALHAAGLDNGSCGHEDPLSCGRLLRSSGRQPAGASGRAFRLLV
ncbi:MAG: DUF6932 family protein [Thermodesulfobacteriota bacterium]